MRIGIMTFWESQENYGQILQGFALQRYLKENGHDAFTIRFRRIPPVKKKSLWKKVIDFNLTRFIKERKKKYLLSKQPINRGFDDFKTNYMTFSEQVYSSLEELRANPPQADAYMTGSDQVWNNNFKVSCEPFLLGFGSNQVKRIAYAASFGVSSLDESAQQLFQKYLPAFDKIGVREKGGVQICNDLGFNNVSWTPDPTLLFTKDRWINILQLENVDTTISKNTFIYTLANSPIQDREQFMSYLKRMPGRKFKHVTANNDIEGDYFPDVREWVQSIRTADFVLTNSFHGMVFCIIFNKRFAVLPNTGNVKGMNERVVSLLTKLDLMHHLLWEYDQEKLDRLMTIDDEWEQRVSTIAEWSAMSTKEIFSVLNS